MAELENRIRKARRIVETKRENPTTGMPFGLELGKQIAHRIVFGSTLSPPSIVMRSMWAEFEHDFLKHSNGDLDWAEEIKMDCALFTGLEMLNLLTDESNNHNSLRELAHDLAFGRRPLLQPNNNNTLFLVTKVPEIGKSKTRLGKTIGYDLACEFAKCCLLDLIERIGNELDTVWHNKVILYFPQQNEGKLRELLVASGIQPHILNRWKLQCFDDTLHEDFPQLQGLGVGLARALNSSQQGMVGFIGADSPHISNALLIRATNKSTICAAMDGGYTLLSLNNNNNNSTRCCCWDCFSQIDWSTSLTFAMQLRAAHRAGFTNVQVDQEVMFDVDDETDLRRLPKQQDGLGIRVLNFLVKHNL